MSKLFRVPRWVSRSVMVAALALAAFWPAAALGGPRSGGSFGGRLGFRSGGGFDSPGLSGGGYGRSYGGGYYGGGPHFLFFPGWGGYGYGGGFGLLAPLVGLMVAGLVVTSIARAVRANRGLGAASGAWDGDEPLAAPGRAYLYRLQIALGRSAREIQDRLAAFAAEGDTASEAGLGALLQQTAVELLRQKDAIRYATADGRGPMSLTNAETAMNGLTLAERGRFQIERVRGADGHVARSAVPAEEAREVLELVVVTVIVATRTPIEGFGPLVSPEELDARLTALGSVAPGGLLGLEVLWTPADPNDSMTETDVMTSYPELRSL